MKLARVPIGTVAALTLVVACGGANATDKASTVAARPVLSIARASRLFNTYSVLNNQVNSRFSAVRDQAIEEPPASVGSISGLRVAQAEGRAIPGTQYFGTRFAVPAITGYPRLFLATTQARSNGTTFPGTIYFLFVQDMAGAPWRVAYYPFAGGQVPVPPVAVSANGSAPAVTNGRGLLADPAALPAAIYAHATGQKAATSSVPLAPTPALDQQLTAGYTSGVQEYKSRHVNVYQTLVPTTFPIYLIRARGGGALAFTADEVRTQFIPMHAGVLVHLPSGSSYAALAGHPGGAAAARYSILRLQMFMSYIPPRNAPGSGVAVVSYADFPVSVTR